MKRSKLKKKANNNSIIFPTTYLNPTKHNDLLDKNEDQLQAKRLHRVLSKSKDKVKDRSSCPRSLSVNFKDFDEGRKNNQATNYCQKLDQNKRKLSAEKRLKRGSSAIEISKIYYDNLEKKLQDECQIIMKQQYPKMNFKSINLERLSSNLLRIKQKPSFEKAKSYKSIKKKTQSQFQTSKHIQKSQLSIKQNTKLDDFLKDFDQYKQMTKKLVSNVDISISGQQLDVLEQELFQDYRHHNSLMNDLTNTHQSQQSIFKSQINATLIEMLEKTPIYFFSPKFTIKYPTFFKIISLKIILNEQQKAFEMDVFFKMYNEIIFKRISFKATPQKKMEYRGRKGHLKRMQMIREKIKERVLSNFMRQYSEDLVIEFYQDFILYLQHFILFEKTYRGLLFIDNQQNSLELKNHERIFEMLRINKSFYFIMKLNYTFYIVKVSYSQMEIKFTFIYDFTTHNTGDQLTFTHTAPQKLKGNKNEAQTYKIFLKVIGEFVEELSSEWKCEYTTNKQILQKESTAKISQITTSPLQKWDDAESNQLPNINKQYHFIGGLTNFFEFHDHFDYGYFNTPHHLQVNGKYNYILDQIKKYVPVYIYPHTYIYLDLNQIQRQMIAIPHLTQTKYQKHKDKFVNDFFHRQISKNYKKKHEYFTLFIGKNQIRMKQRSDILDIYMNSSSNLRCQKLSVPINQFPSYTIDQYEQLDLKKASSYVSNFMKQYRAEKSFLYSKFIPESQSNKPIIYHKGVQKLERQFVFITLYGLPLHQIIQFKIFMFKFGRQFIIRFDSIDWLKDINLKELIASLIQLIKSIYFRNLIQEEARKSKKRKLDSLQNFLKKHGKSYVNQIRSKKKLDEQIKRRMMRLANFKQNNMNTLVYQNIITDSFRPSSGKQFFITIRFVPSEQFREQNEWKNESIEICIHKQGSIHYFKLITTMKQLIFSVSQGKLSLEHIDFRQVHHVFKQIRNKIKQIIKTSHKSLNFTISRLKHFLIYNYQLPSPQIYPFKFKLVQNIIYQTKNNVDSDQIQSQISIEYQMEKHPTFSSNNNLIFSPCFGSEQKQQVSTNFSFICRKPINHPYKRFLDQTHLIQIIDIFRKNQDYKLLKEYNRSTREIWITDRETGCRSILSQWDNGFLSVINFGQYNNRMFRRLLKSLRPAL